MKKEIKNEMTSPQIIKEVFELGRESAILSSRGWDISKQDSRLSELYKLNPEAYSIGYKKVRRSFGY